MKSNSYRVRSEELAVPVFFPRMSSRDLLKIYLTFVSEFHFHSNLTRQFLGNGNDESVPPPNLPSSVFRIRSNLIIRILGTAQDRGTNSISREFIDKSNMRRRRSERRTRARVILKRKNGKSIVSD